MHILLRNQIIKILKLNLIKIIMKPSLEKVEIKMGKKFIKRKRKINEILDLDVIDVEKNRKFKIREIVK